MAGRHFTMLVVISCPSSRYSDCSEYCVDYQYCTQQHRGYSPLWLVVNIGRRSHWSNVVIFSVKFKGYNGTVIKTCMLCRRPRPYLYISLAAELFAELDSKFSKTAKYSTKESQARD